MSARIHLLPSPALQAYQDKRLANLRMLGPALRIDLWLQARGVTEITRAAVAKSWMAFHAWRPGFVALDDAEAAVARVPTPDDDVVDLNGLMLHAIYDFAALQNPWELEQFLARVAARRPKTIVEIGTSGGGLLFAMAQLADPAATLISIDVPELFDKPEAAAAVPRILRALVRPTQTLHLLRERSTIHDVRVDTARLLAGRGVDLLVIDGDHSYGGVRSDFEMYSGLVAPGGLVAFHDVTVRPENSGRGFDVGLYWDELRRAHQQTETLADPEGVVGLGTQLHLPYEQRRSVTLGWGLLTIPG